MTIKLMKHYVTDGETKARVWYNKGNYVDGFPGVTIYAKDYGNKLSAYFPGKVKNESEIMTDYFDTDSVRLGPGDENYEVALARAEAKEKEFEEKMARWTKKSEERIARKKRTVVSTKPDKLVSLRVLTPKEIPVEEALLTKITEKDEEGVKKLEKKMKAGEIVRIY